MKRLYYLGILFAIKVFPVCSQSILPLPFPKWWEPEGIELFRKEYPNIEFISHYDTEKNDWLVHMNVPSKHSNKKEVDLYWCDSKFLPKDKLEYKHMYRPMLYNYPKTTPNPTTFTEETIEKIRQNTSKEQRNKGPSDPPFLYNAIYDVETRLRAESHIKRVKFLGKTISVSEFITEPLQRVNDKIMAKMDNEEIKRFYDTLDRIDGFNWRTVRDTESRSFHSIGLAIDILPKGYYQKNIYWGWAKQVNPNNWMKIPLERRWSPPEEVIKIFEEEGFIWGGKWIIFDNMHFEYHPELIAYSRKYPKNNKRDLAIRVR